MNAMTEAPALPARVAAMTAGSPVKALVPQTFDDVWRIANLLSKSGMAPADMKSPEQISVAIMHGMEVGLPPMMALQSIAVINGRPSLWGDGALALVRATGEMEEFEEGIDGTGDNMRGWCKIKRRGQKPVLHDFSVADATKAKLWGKTGPWTQYPRRMIVMRPRSWCLRDAFADVLKGLRIAEEVMDTDMKDVTPPPAPPAAPPPTVTSAPAAPPPAPPAAPVTEIIEDATFTEVGTDAKVMTYDEKIADWTARLAAADRDTQEEIFETELDPAHEAGEIYAPDWNKLTAMVKDA